MCLCFDFSASWDDDRLLYVFISFAPLIAFLVDIILTLNTSFYQKGALIDNKTNIITNYLNNNLLLDIITIGPMCVSVFG